MSTYKSSYYLDTKREIFAPDAFPGCEHVSVAIVGGGIAGLSCAQQLLTSGISVKLFESNRIFSGASGLNGGFVTPGFSLSTNDLEKKIGRTNAIKLFRITVNGMKKVAQNIDTLNITSAAKTFGKAELFRRPVSERDIEQMETLRSMYDYHVNPVPQEWIASNLASTSYTGGFFHTLAFHIHPLNYGLALARYLQSNGLAVYEQEPVNSITPRNDHFDVISKSGKTVADRVVVCTGGYTSGEDSSLTRSIFPITTYVGVTHPRAELLRKSIKTSLGLGDTRRSSDYYRLVDNQRLLWGGRITAFPSHKHDKIKSIIYSDIVRNYPGLRGITIDKVWSGIMGYARHKMPIINRSKSGIWYCTAFGGRGIAAGTGCGELVANAIQSELANQSDIDEIGIFHEFQAVHAFGLLGKLGVEATYKKYQLFDFFNERKN